MQGEIIGITNSGFVGWGVQNTNFAIPVDTIRRVLAHFDRYGRVIRACLQADFMDDWLAEAGIPTDTGLAIRSIERNAPLEIAGFVAGNTLFSISGVAVNSTLELNEALKHYMPGDTVTVGIHNGTEMVYAQIVLGERGE